MSAPRLWKVTTTTRAEQCIRIATAEGNLLCVSICVDDMTLSGYPLVSGRRPCKYIIHVGWTHEEDFVLCSGRI
eukprot:220816-Pyramimonas_sp.AAC.1